MTPALYRHAIYTGFRMCAYEEIRNRLDKIDDKGRHHGFPLWKKVLAGMLAGGFGQFFASPTDLVKTQIQMEGRRRLMGLEPRVDGMMAGGFGQFFASPTDLVKTQIQMEGRRRLMGLEP